jgi:D-alanine-D-alanine ligase
MEAHSRIHQLLQQYQSLIQDRSVIIVCNTKLENDTSIDEKKPFDAATEYLSNLEFEQVVTMFASCCPNLEIFTHEYEFFEHILNERTLEKNNIIVYNSAQSGSGAGRKSLIPAFCNLVRIICTGSNPYVVGLCRHKYHVNKLLENANLPTPKSWLFDHNWLFNAHPDNEMKVIMKPIYESASIGIDRNSIFHYRSTIDKKIMDKNIEMDQPIIVQEFISGYEIELPLLCIHDAVLPFVPIGLSLYEKEKRMQNEILDYERIYFDRYKFFDFSKEGIYNPQIIDTAAKVVKILGMSGLCRVDFRIDEHGKHYVTDVSTNPHFISHSSVNYAAHLMGLCDSDIIRCILLAAIKCKEVEV